MALLYCTEHYFSKEYILHIYKSVIRRFIEYCCHILSASSAIHLDILHRIQRRIYNVIGQDLASPLELHTPRFNNSSRCFFYIYFHGDYSDELSSLVSGLHKFKSITRLADRSHYFIVESFDTMWL